MIVPHLQGFIKSIERHELTHDLQLLADVVGLETVRQLLQHLPGQEIYLPHPRNLKDAVERYIRENYEVSSDGESNVRQLALTLGVRKKYIEKVLKSLAAKAS